jgi:hypothetical protein
MHAHTVNQDALAASASVTLDIGCGRGALVIYPAERFRGQEIEISPTGTGARRVHTGVHERRAHQGSVLTAIFGSLQTGEYDIWSDADTRAASVEVRQGAVTEIALT